LETEKSITMRPPLLRCRPTETSDRMDWCNLACLLQWCHETVATNAAARAEIEVNYSNERVCEKVFSPKPPLFELHCAKSEGTCD
jgi:hypothetical protein